MGHEVPGHRGQKSPGPLALRTLDGRRRLVAGFNRCNPPMKLGRKRTDPPAAERQSVVGRHAGAGGRAFHHVEPVHLALVGPATFGEPPGVLQRRRMAGQQIRAERYNHLGLAQIEMHTVRVVVGRDRLVLEPARLGERLRELLAQACERGRAGRLGQYAKTLAPGLLELAEVLAHESREVGPRFGNLLRARRLDDRLAAVRVVKLEDRGLGQRVGTAQALRMLGVPLDLDRPAVDRSDQKPHGRSTQVHRRGKALRLAGCAIGRALVEREDLLPFPTAPPYPGRGQRDPDRLEPPSPGHAAVVVRSGKLRLGKLAVLRREGKLVQAPPVRAGSMLVRG